MPLSVSGVLEHKNPVKSGSKDLCSTVRYLKENKENIFCL